MRLRWQMGVVLVSVILFPFVLSIAGDADSERQVLGDLLMELEQKITDADRRMIAHPKFLEELRALVKQYRAKLRVVFLSDDFSDGDYSKNPTWVVDSGHFQVTSSRRLMSEVAVEDPRAAPSSSEKTSPLAGIFKEILKTTGEGKEEEKPPSAEGEARIHTVAKIGPEFEVDLTVVSRSTWGSMEVVLLGGDPPIPRYRMIYRAASSAQRPIEIVRERDARSYVIETATQYPSLDDGKPHRLQWVRDSQGRMQVIVDGNDVLSTYEIYYREAFAGLALVNRGGTYEWGPVSVFRAPEGKGP